MIYKLTPDGKSSVFMEHSGYQKYDIWRVGFMQTNGRDRSDPKFEEFPMIGSNGLTLDRQGRLDHRDLVGPLDRSHREERQADGSRRFLSGQAL